MRGHRLQAQARQPPEHLDPDPPPPERAVDEKLKHRQRHQRVPPARGGQMPVHRQHPSGERHAAEKPDDDLAGHQREAEQQHLGHDGIPVPHRLRDDTVESFLLARDPTVGHELVDDEPGPLVQRRIGQQQKRDRDQQARVHAPVDDEGVSYQNARGQRHHQQWPPGHGDEHHTHAQVVDPPVWPRPAEVPQQRRERPAVDQRKTSYRRHREEHGAAAGARARGAGRFSDRLTPAEARFTTARARFASPEAQVRGTGAPAGYVLVALALGAVFGRPRRRAIQSARAASR